MYHPELAGKVDAQRQAIMNMGKDIEAEARRCFPGGHLVTATYRQSTLALEQTATLLMDPTVPAIFEGAFQFQGTFVRVDVLERMDDHTWRLIEIKASSRAKAVHLDDLTLQTYVLLSAGLTLSASCLMHVNRQYLFKGDVPDVQQLFAIQDFMETVQERLPAVPGQLAAMRAVLTEAAPPVIAPGPRCHTPHSCPFWEYCTETKPARWIYHLPGKKETFYKLTKRGIVTIDDIPSDFSLTDIQRRMKENVEWISPQLLSRLRTISYPLHHLDFETLMPGIPLYEGTRPYQPLPVQWSNHIECQDHRLHHDAFLSRTQQDPREEFVVTLLASLGTEGNICVYSEYEQYVLLALAEAIPQYKRELLQVVGRLWDLLSVIQSFYYHPGFSGSFSIKSVLPALIPSLSYHGLDIQDGVQATAAHYRMVFLETDWVERERLATALLEYCARDTLAMVELRKILLDKAEHAIDPSL
ncbi:MAG: DUF2779 domain-containing protein [Nitrospirales bacterium]|nr:DUF2779 domain-containing protein [Nitrospirales bacterium]